MPEIYGFPDGMIGEGAGKISKHLIAWIIGEEGNVCVQGLIGQGTSRELSANWEQPFNSDTLMSFIKSSGPIGSLAGKVFDAGGGTAVTSYNTRQVWNSGSHSLNLVLKFMAFADPVKEVMGPIAMLEKLASVDPAQTVAQAGSKPGRQPSPITLNIGRITMFKELVIKSVSTPLDKEKDKNGNLIRAEVSVSLEPYEMINRMDIFGSFKM